MFSIILLSATSYPASTCILVMNVDGGVESAWFDTKIKAVLVRMAARNKMSLIILGQASASTQICINSPYLMAALRYLNNVFFAPVFLPGPFMTLYESF